VVRNLDFRKLAQAAAIAADDKKADGVVVLDVRKESDVSDYVVIAGANSSAQLRALFETVEDTLLELGVKALRRDGRERGRWVAIDYGGLMVHVMLSEAREFYRLEQLWEKAKSVKWQERAHRGTPLHAR
jgi:ribosome-associated protein